MVAVIGRRDGDVARCRCFCPLDVRRGTRGRLRIEERGSLTFTSLVEAGYRKRRYEGRDSANCLAWLGASTIS